VTRANGFTLIELLIAMTAGALLLASMSWVVARLSRDMRQSKLGAPERELLTVSDRLASLIATARAGPGDDITLSDRQLSFVADPPLSVGPVGLVQAELRITGRPTNQQLELSLRDGLGRTIGESRPSILLRDQQQMRFEWAGETGAAGRVIAFRTVDAEGKAHALMLPLRINGDPNCQFDVISMACR
jgi:prepilin-type N-terminal cleavage/methylation domain-containing protein